MQFIAPLPFQEALDKLGNKSPIGAGLSSSQWSAVPLALRERAMFSAQIESIRFLARAQERIGDFLTGARETLPDGQVALKTGGRAQFVEAMRGFAVAEGMGPLDPKDAGTIKDIRSQKRLELIFDTQVKQAHEFGNWKQGMDPDVLDAFPAQRFIRVVDVVQPRDPHMLVEGAVALKTDLTFWTRINEDFGVPWGPWGWGCGHDVEDVDREEAEQRGFLQPGETVQPVEKEFNDRLEASVRNLDPELLARLKADFGDQVDVSGDVVRWVGRAGVPPAPIAPPPTSAVRPRPPEPIPAPPGRPTLAGVLKDAGLGPGEKATPSSMHRLRALLKEDHPLHASEVIKSVDGLSKNPIFGEMAIRQDVQAFVDFVPAEKLKRLPKLKIQATDATDHLGQYARNGRLDISTSCRKAERRRRTMFHELMHWLHLEGGDEFKAAIKKHFQTRTKGEKIARLGNYRRAMGKKDKWYEVYAGRVYDDGADPIGYEVPTRYIEWLVMDAQDASELWNKPEFRQTMEIVLQALF